MFVSADGGYAVAVPGFGNRVALGGRSLAWTLEDPADERAFGVGQTTDVGVISRPLTLPAKHHAVVGGFSGSRQRLALFTSPSRASRGVGHIWAGPRGGVMRAYAPENERLPATRSCRRRIAHLGDPGGGQDLTVSGERVAYGREVTCRSAKRRTSWQLVVRNLRTGKTRVLRRAPAGDVQFAGDFVSYRRDVRNDDRRIYVVRASTGRLAYRASLTSVIKESVDAHYSLGADGTVAVAYFAGLSDKGRLGWFSPASRRLHKLGRVAVFSSSPLKYANGRIVYVSRYVSGGDELAITTLRGATTTVATFARDEQLDAFDFDGEQIAFAHSKYRPDRGRADDGLPSQCWANDKIRVQARAAIIEVHGVQGASRLAEARLPIATPQRSAADTRPECPYKD